MIISQNNSHQEKLIVWIVQGFIFNIHKTFSHHEEWDPVQDMVVFLTQSTDHGPASFQTEISHFGGSSKISHNTINFTLLKLEFGEFRIYKCMSWALRIHALIYILYSYIEYNIFSIYCIQGQARSFCHRLPILEL